MTDQPTADGTLDVEIFDPPLCCPTGPLRPRPRHDVGRSRRLVSTLTAEGHSVVRHMMTSDPQAFMRNTTVYDLIKAAPARGAADHRRPRAGRQDLRLPHLDELHAALAAGA